MTLTFAAYFSDGSSTMVTFEKPPGYHPESAYVGLVAARAATQNGKICVRTARPRGNLTNKDGLPIIQETTIWEGREPDLPG